MSFLTSIMHPLLTPGIIDDLRSKHILTVMQFLQADIAQIASITTLKFKVFNSVNNTTKTKLVPIF